MKVRKGLNSEKSFGEGKGKIRDSSLGKHLNPVFVAPRKEDWEGGTRYSSVTHWGKRSLWGGEGLAGGAQRESSGAAR